MNLTIPDDLLKTNHLSSKKIKQDIAIFLLEKCNLTLAEKQVVRRHLVEI